MEARFHSIITKIENWDSTKVKKFMGLEKEADYVILVFISNLIIYIRINLEQNSTFRLKGEKIKTQGEIFLDSQFGNFYNNHIPTALFNINC